MLFTDPMNSSHRIGYFYSPQPTIKKDIDYIWIKLQRPDFLMIPEPRHTDLNFTDFIMLLGVVQGILLTITGLFRQSRKEKFKALLFFSISCIITEIFLNRTSHAYVY